MRSKISDTDFLKESVWKKVSKVRIARPTPSLPALAAFYQRVIGLHLASSFNGHAGFDGTIFRTTADGPEWELTQGPHDSLRPASRTGWKLGWVGVTTFLIDPDGFDTAVRPSPVSSADVIFSRHTDQLGECLNFYSNILGWACIESKDELSPRSISITLPTRQGSLRLHESVRPVPAPTVEDLVVAYFPTHASREDAVNALAHTSTPVLTPNNPWWHDHAICFADPDGFGLALAC